MDPNNTPAKPVEIQLNFKLRGIFVRDADEETKKDAYYKLGVLSTTFAELEQLVQDLLIELVSFDRVLGIYIIQDNTLEKNLQLFERILPYKHWKEPEIKKLIQRIKADKTHRNNLIHGKWSIGINFKTEQPTVTVSKAKIKQGFCDVNKAPYWGNKTEYNYTFAELDAQIDRCKAMVEELKVFIAPWRQR